MLLILATISLALLVALVAGLVLLGRWLGRPPIRP